MTIAVDLGRNARKQTNTTGMLHVNRAELGRSVVQHDKGLVPMPLSLILLSLKLLLTLSLPTGLVCLSYSMLFI